MLQRQLAESQRLLAAERIRYESIENFLRIGIERFGGTVKPGKLDMGTISLESHYIERMEAELEAQEQRVEDQERRVAEDLEALLQASRDRKILEKLKENMESAFHRELANKDQKRAEELALSRHLLRQSA